MFIISLGHVNAVATIENIIEHVASYLKKDKLEIRMLNMVPANVPRLLCPEVERNVIKDDVLPLLKVKAAYHERMVEVEQYNQVSLYVPYLIPFLHIQYLFVVYFFICHFMMRNWLPVFNLLCLAATG